MPEGIDITEAEWTLFERDLDPDFQRRVHATHRNTTIDLLIADARYEATTSAVSQPIVTELANAAETMLHTIKDMAEILSVALNNKTIKEGIYAILNLEAQPHAVPVHITRSPEHG